MARPTTKQDLIQTANETYFKLIQMIDTMHEDLLNKPFSFSVEKEKGAHWARDKNVRDVIAHLYEWHQLLIHWIESNQKGEDKPFLLDGYNWKNYGSMNQMFWEKHQSTSLDDALSNLKNTHLHIMNCVEDFSNDALFSKGVFSWTKGSTLGSYIVSSTSSHYEWAYKKIKKHVKSNQT
ncbi:hypothetical protein AOC36_04415 [Erysipelothrix larvae]|uniref:ClbS/DfsB family four-helix bundle protein n=1 Tax=Erysipelothrix larvae TaxID=1514105 RepID=A0A120JTL4_9FIRM|nr:ClbS/DfsB family four-helix bundle protein [Erysipelothrix larvae]AMC93241.1 hypothetical protein AOC36_04415 [Erysipelothrix larvae]